MKTNGIMNNLTRSFHKVGFKLKKHSPEILVVSGVVGTVATTILACKATTKLSEVLESSKKDIDAIHEFVENEGYSEKYSEQDEKKDLAIVYTQATVKVAKLYAPSVALGVLSVTSILAGHNVLRKRSVALAAAYTAVDKSFKEYRGRVVERFGKELDRELRYNIKAKEVVETVVDEDGNVKEEVKTVKAVDPNDISEFARFFDDGCRGWDKDPEYNLTWLHSQQSLANNMLKTKGYLFLNEVYEMLGIPRTRAGQVVGWFYDKKNPTGDNFVDFGIFDATKPANRDFVNGYERTILLDFNVDGPILDMI